METTGIIKTHKGEVKALQQSIFTKQKTLSESESNITAIGTYVDKLQERLTSFAIMRRDMEEREKRGARKLKRLLLLWIRRKMHRK
jgi:hypothetical protein